MVRPENHDAGELARDLRESFFFFFFNPTSLEFRHIIVSLSVSLATRLSVSACLCVSACLSVCLPVGLSVCLSICLSARLPTCLILQTSLLTALFLLIPDQSEETDAILCLCPTLQRQPLCHRQQLQGSHLPVLAGG